MDKNKHIERFVYDVEKILMMTKQRYVEKKMVERKKNLHKRIDKKWKKKKEDSCKEKERRKIDHTM